MARGLTIIAALIAMLFMAVGAAADDGADGATGRRIALVIGNANYSVAQLALTHPKNDAEDVGAALKALGFEVITSTDLSLSAFDAAVRDFKAKADGAEVALFFYAGHAVQSEGVNFFIPVDADITQEAQLKRAAVSISDIQDALAGVQGVKVMILDSCRDNPFSSLRTATRGIDGQASRGLNRIALSSGDSIVLYSTLTNDVAADGAPGDRNSPFSRVLVDILKRPGERALEDILKDVAKKVKQESGGKQSPEMISSISGEYKFSPVNDRSEWDAIKNSLDPKTFRRYAERFPFSAFRNQADRRAGLLEDQERLRRSSTMAKSQSDQDLKACKDNYERLDLLRAGGDLGGLQKLQRDNTCERLKPSIEAAVADATRAKLKSTCDRLLTEFNDFGQNGNVAGLTAIQSEAAPCAGLSDRIGQAIADVKTAEEARRQQGICDRETGQLKTLVTAAGPRRTADVATLAAAAQCPSVRVDAQRAADDFGKLDAADAQAARDRICTAENNKLQDALAKGSRAQIVALVTTHTCDTLDPQAVLAQFDDRAEKARQQALCDSEGATFKVLSNAQGRRRTADVTTFAASAKCPAVKTMAQALATTLHDQDVAALHQAQQNLVCAAEDKIVQDAIAGSVRASIEALAQSHACETLDVPAALARFDDTMQNRLALQQKTCAAADVAGLAERQDDKGLADLLAKCPTRGDDIAAAQAGIRDKRQLADACRREGEQLQQFVNTRQAGAVADLQRRATCPTLDFPAAIVAISVAACTQGLRDVGGLRDDDEAGLRTSAGNADLCPEARTAAQQKLDRLASARSDDALCEQKIAEANGRGDAEAVKALRGQGICARRLDAIARAADMLRMAAEACNRAVSAVDRVVDGDQDTLRRYTTDRAFCARAQQKATDRLARLDANHEGDAACDKAVADAKDRGDVDQLKGLQGQDVCARRRDVVARAIGDVQTTIAQSQAQSDCDKSVAAVAAAAADDETALHGFASDSRACQPAQKAAAARLAQLTVARQSADLSCDKSVADAARVNDVEAITRLGGDAACVRRHEEVAKAIDAAKTGRVRVVQAKLAQIGCFTGRATGTPDDSTSQAVALYRKAKNEDGPVPELFAADFVTELSSQSGTVCVREASLKPDVEPNNPAVVPGPPVQQPDVVPEADNPAPSHRPSHQKAEPSEPAPPRLKKRFSAPEPRPQPEPRVRPQPRQYADPAPRVRPAPSPRPAAPQEVAKPAGHIFY